jgi:O-antigen ligase
MMFHSGTHLSHTLLITLLSEGGLIGTGLFAVFLYAVWRELVRIRREEHSGLARIALVACTVIFLVKLVDTFFNPSMYDNLFWLTLGLIGAIGRFPLSRPDAVATKPRVES